MKNVDDGDDNDDLKVLTELIIGYPGQIEDKLNYRSFPLTNCLIIYGNNLNNCA